MNGAQISVTPSGIHALAGADPEELSSLETRSLAILLQPKDMLELVEAVRRSEPCGTLRFLHERYVADAVSKLADRGFVKYHGTIPEVDRRRHKHKRRRH